MSAKVYKATEVSFTIGGEKFGVGVDLSSFLEEKPDYSFHVYGLKRRPAASPVFLMRSFEMSMTARAVDFGECFGYPRSCVSGSGFRFLARSWFDRHEIRMCRIVALGHFLKDAPDYVEPTSTRVDVDHP